MFSKTSRRNFLLAGLTLAGTIAWKTQAKQAPNELATLPIRILGKTGVEVPIFGLGGAGKTPLSKPGKEAESRRLIEAAFTGGIRYFDTAASYGPSEEYLGKVIPSFRNQVFLASKTGARSRDGALRDLERSLQRLNTDHLDLWQLHHVSFNEELDQIFSQNGAIKALEEAIAQKIVRFSGITGHHEPQIIADGLTRYPFDTTLITLNAADIHHPRPFSTSVLPLAQSQNVGVIAMKVPAYGRLFKPGVLDGMHEALGYSLSLPGVHCCIVAAEDVAQLQSNLNVARNYQPLNLAQMQTIEQKTAHAWEDNNFFRAWT
ncbi:aldo/keto reductase [Gloeocapsa sp. PCC 73106]|uniref:aldo/keto reductase n=1 Tax=Gloeocapsa sp. PCC 73106 TaxID=102232 RepID=UPI0002AC6811|nr:aldo/keto reductase [Gloeocapsa sp. PCC 73106]ELR96734.1 putative oxidoreductase, aryl-alcohol dehydrogenase like protein [Gloeocapsa sp. PCC 73106]